MNFKKNEDFDKYVNCFKNLSLREKQKITIEELKKIIALFEKINIEQNNQTTILFNKEILYLNNEYITEDDYAEAVFVYINSIQELIAEYIINNK